MEKIAAGTRVQYIRSDDRPNATPLLGFVKHWGRKWVELKSEITGKTEWSCPDRCVLPAVSSSNINVASTLAQWQQPGGNQQQPAENLCPWTTLPPGSTIGFVDPYSNGKHYGKLVHYDQKEQLATLSISHGYGKKSSTKVLKTSEATIEKVAEVSE